MNSDKDKRITNLVNLEDALVYPLGKKLVMSAFKYQNRYGINKEEILEPANNLSVTELKDAYNQVIIRMGGRAAQELFGLEVSTEEFYNDLKLAIPHMKNIAAIENEAFPDIASYEYEELFERYYKVYILTAKNVITTIAEYNKITSVELIKKIVFDNTMRLHGEYS